MEACYYDPTPPVPGRRLGWNGVQFNPETRPVPVARQRIHLPPAAWRRAVSSAFSHSLWMGESITELERAFAGFIGAPDAVAVPSGRAGLRFIFDALGLEPGAEVICSAFAYPVVPKGKARIRVQLSAAHTKEELDEAIKAFISAGRKLKVIQ